MRQFRYHPFYCEENAWWLCAVPRLAPGPRYVVFVGNQRGHCPFLHQRAAAPGALCWWDYHVVVLDGARRIWDLDSRLPQPMALAAWLHASFPFAERLPGPLRPRFRVVRGAAYLRDFTSDRSHMRDDAGNYHYPPPPWPAIGAGMNLHDYTSMASPRPGALFELGAFANRFGDPAR